MKTLYLDCGMGAAGDMLAAALLELLPDSEEFVKRLNALGLPGVRFEAERSVKCGIAGTHLSVTVRGEEEHSHDRHGYEYREHRNEHPHSHPHPHGREQSCPHEHTHPHEHRGSLGDIEHLVRGHLPVSDRVKDGIMAVYRLIAEAESAVHGVPVSDIHFHEVGTLDAVADIAAVCLLMESLAPERVVVSPVHVGSGQVKCAHGILPVPAPATAQLLRGVPTYGGRIRGELCTPTGAALLRHFATEFGDMPVMVTHAIGYGMGRKDFEAANCVRVLLGETAAGSTVVELCCNVDDMTAEAVGFATEMLLEAGALEVYTVPIGMKKSRPGILLCVMCREGDRDALTRLIFKHTTTIGIREQISRRYTLDRRLQTVETPLGPVRKKISEGYGVVREKPEYEDLAALARQNGLSLREVAAYIEAEEQ